MMETTLNFLIIEDSDMDVDLMVRHLRRSGYDFNFFRVETEGEMERALKSRHWDLVLSDYVLPQFSGLEALEVFKRHELEIPFIVVSGAIGEETAVEMIRAGANDYLIKGNLTRLGPAIDRELREAEHKRNHKKSEIMQMALYRISHAAATAKDMDCFYREIHTILVDLMDARNFFIALYDAEMNLIKYPYYQDEHDNVPDPHLPERGLTEYILRTGESVLITPGLFRELMTKGEVDQSSHPTLDWMGVPLHRQDQVIGVMVVRNYNRSNRYTEKQLAILDFISGQVEILLMKKLAEESHQESEKKFELFMNNLPLNVFINDSKGNTIFTNQGVFPGIDSPFLKSQIKKELYQKIEFELIEDDQDTFTNGSTHRLISLPFEDQKHFFEVIKFHIERQDQAPLTGGIAWDITDRINAEQRILQSSFELEKAYDATLEGWSYALELREKETAGHAQRTVSLTLDLARRLKLPEDQMIHIRRGVLLHDIGKMAISDNILLKPGPLNEQEWKEMRQHPSYAYQLLAPIPYLKLALDIPFSHHEYWDGSGYTRGLKGEQIPIAARIFSVVDVWDALHSNRPYRKAWPTNRIVEYIRANSGVQFDPDVVEPFLSILEEQGLKD
jgi:response regulator RpfG family c-di-GMP phosphodiesterase